jgi:hypothetical protein
MIIKPIAAVLVVALLVVGVIAVTFIAGDKKLIIESTFKLELVTDHEPTPAPVPHRHTKQLNPWGT